MRYTHYIEAAASAMECSLFDDTANDRYSIDFNKTQGCVCVCVYAKTYKHLGIGIYI